MNDPFRRGPTLLALALAIVAVAPAAAQALAQVDDSYEIAIHQNVLYNVRGDRDHLVIQQPVEAPSAFTLRVLGPTGTSADYAVPAEPRTVLPLTAFDGQLGSGAWTLRDDLRGLRTFTAEVHITDRAGRDGAQPCEGGYSAVGGHPQVFLHTIVWLENANACAVEAAR